MHSNTDYLVKQKLLEKGRCKGSKDYFDKSETLLHVDKLCVEFPSYNTSTVACNQLTFEVKRGEILGIVGESGSGKSVSVLSILQLIPAPGRITSGSIYFNGSNLLSSPKLMSERAVTLKPGIFLIAECLLLPTTPYPTIPTLYVIKSSDK